MSGPDNFPAVRRATALALAAGDPEGALERLLRHLTHQTQDRAGHLQAFALCERLYRYDQAVAHARQAWALDRTDPQPMTGAAMLLFLNARFKESLAILREVEPPCGGEAESMIRLAEVAHRAGQGEAATSYATRALELRPGLPRAVWVMALLESSEGQLETARTRLEDSLGKNNHHPDRWRLLSQLGTVQDAMGDYGPAFASVTESRQILARQDPSLAQKARRVHGLQEAVIRHLGTADYQRWQEQASHFPRARLAVLAGHTRSGTTLLEQRLTACPDAIGTGESGVFNREFAKALFYAHGGTAMDALTEWESWDAEALDAGRSTFLTLTEAVIGQPVGNRLLIEKDPLRTPDLPLFLRLFPESSILMPLRHPCDIALSVWMTLLPIGREGWPASSPAAALESVAHTLHCWSILKERLPQPWREVHYETFTAQPDRETAALADFLKLRHDPQATPAECAAAPARGISTPSWTHAAGPVHATSVNRWHRYAEHFGPLAKPYGALFREFGYEI